MSGIKLRTAAVSDDHDRVLAFLREHFYREEPLTIGFQINEPDEQDEKFNMSNLAHGTCVVAEDFDSRDANGQPEIVGAAMAGPKYRGEAERMMEEAELLDGTSWGAILSLLARVEAKANVFDRFNVDSAVHCHALAVHRNTRGKAIGTQLITKSIELAKDKGFPVFTCDCTGTYSAVVCEKFGMKHISTYMYADYCDGNGRQICTPPAIHDAIKTFLQIL